MVDIMARPLNPKQRAFCKAYIKHGNATEACKEAGYSTKWPGKYGSELYRNPRIRMEIAQMIGGYVKRKDVSLDAIVGQLWFHASSGERDKETVSSLKALLDYAKGSPMEGDEKSFIKLAYSLPPAKGPGIDAPGNSAVVVPESTKLDPNCKIDKMTEDEIIKELDPNIDPDLGF